MPQSAYSGIISRLPRSILPCCSTVERRENMISSSAVLFFSRGQNREDPPALLKNILFQPAAVWLTASLRRAGVTRFFAIAHAVDAEAVQACMPEGTPVACPGMPDFDDQLKNFAEYAKDGKLILIAKPVWLSQEACDALTNAPKLISEGAPTGVLRVNVGDVCERGLYACNDGEDLSPMPPEETYLCPLDSQESFDMVSYLVRADRVKDLSAKGVRFLAPDSVFLDPAVEIGRGTMVMPNTFLRGNTVVGADCEIGPNSVLNDVVVGDGTTVNSSQLNQCRVGSHTTVGPFAYVRPKSVIGDNVKVGDFVEIKNSVIGNGTKISHLTYVGDSDVGERVNFGCGTVTVNYDGNKKYRTTIGNDCFIGCNTNLVAPVTVEDGAYTAAGTTVTDTVPADALAIGRARQVNKAAWAAAHREEKNK